MTARGATDDRLRVVAPPDALDSFRCRVWLAYLSLLDARHDGRHGFAACPSCYAARDLYRAFRDSP